jgi:hypothetical protein
VQSSRKVSAKAYFTRPAAGSIRRAACIRLLASLERIEERVTSRAFEQVDGSFVLFLAGLAKTLEYWTIRYMKQSARTGKSHLAQAVRP